MTYYKVTGKNGESLHGGDLTWSLPTEENGVWTPGAWAEVEGEIVVCSNGLHLTTEPSKWYRTGCRLFVAEGEGDCDAEEDKIAFRRARLLREVPHPDWWQRSQNFVASLKAVPFFKPDGRPLPEWKLFTAPTWAAAWGAARGAAGAAARAAAWNTAWDAARNAAWGAARGAAGAAAWNAARDAARDAAWNAARAAARAAAWNTIWDAAWNAAWGAALYNEVEFVCADLNIDQKHRDHATRRWEVWRKGYVVLCDMDGVLYVYAAETATPECADAPA
jgi:hypothetical protein